MSAKDDIWIYDVDYIIMPRVLYVDVPNLLRQKPIKNYDDAPCNCIFPYDKS